MKILFETEAESRARYRAGPGNPGNPFGMSAPTWLRPHAQEVLAWVADFCQRELGIADYDGEVLIRGEEVDPHPVGGGVVHVMGGHVGPVTDFGPDGRHDVNSNKFALFVSANCAPEMIWALCHEMTHVKQFVTGEFAGSTIGTGEVDKRVFRGVVEVDSAKLNELQRESHGSRAEFARLEMKTYNEYASEKDARDSAVRLMAAMRDQIPTSYVEDALKTCGCRQTTNRTLFDQVPTQEQADLERNARMGAGVGGVEALLTALFGPGRLRRHELHVDRVTGEVTGIEKDTPQEVIDRAMEMAQAVKEGRGDQLHDMLGLRIKNPDGTVVNTNLTPPNGLLN